MDLLVAVDDYCLTKVIVTASVAGVKVNVTKGISHEELALLDAASKSMVLKTSSGIITQHVAMLRFIAEMVPAVQLTGVTAFDAALVDQWLDFSWCELGTLQSKPFTDIYALSCVPFAISVMCHLICPVNPLSPSAEVPVQLLQVLKASDCSLAQSERSIYENKAVADIISALKIVEKHLKSQTYFVGERLTIADISYFSVIGALLKLGAIDVMTMFPAIFRCYMTVGSQKLVAKVAGPVAVPVMAAAPQSVVESTRIDAGNFPGKWQRNRTRVKELLYKDTAMIGKVRCFTAHS